MKTVTILFLSLAAVTAVAGWEFEIGDHYGHCRSFEIGLNSDVTCEELAEDSHLGAYGCLGEARSDCESQGRTFIPDTLTHYPSSESAGNEEVFQCYPQPPPEGLAFIWHYDTYDFACAYPCQCVEQTLGAHAWCLLVQNGEFLS